MRYVVVAVGWLILMASSASARAEGCVLSAEVGRVFALLQAEVPLDRVQEQLEVALACPDADVDAELQYLRALVALRTGRIPEAIAAAKRSQAAAISDDLARERAMNLTRLLETQLAPVTFQPPDGSSHAVSVRIKKVHAGTLPEDKALEPLMPEGLEAFAAGTWLSVVRIAREECATRDVTPMTVWLPRGTYELSSGEVLMLKEGGRERVMTISDIRLPRHMTTVSVGVGTAIAMSDDVASIYGLTLGPVLEHAVRLGSDLQLTGTLAFHAFAPGTGCGGTTAPERDARWLAYQSGCTREDGGEGAHRPLETMLTVGVGRPFGIGPGLTFLVGAAAGGLFSPAGWGTPGFYLYASGIVRPETRLAYQLPIAAAKGFVSLGAGLGIGVPLLCSTSEGEEVGYGVCSSRGTFLVPEVRLGGNIAF